MMILCIYFLIFFCDFNATFFKEQRENIYIFFNVGYYLFSFYYFLIFSVFTLIYQNSVCTFQLVYFQVFYLFYSENTFLTYNDLVLVIRTLNTLSTGMELFIRLYSRNKFDTLKRFLF